MARTTARTVRRRLAAIALAVTPLVAGSAFAQAPAAAPYASTAIDTAHGDREFHLLWPDGAPGAIGTEPVDKPKITVYRAPADRANGAAVVVCPGGGYRVVAADHEGKQIAEWLNSLGVSAPSSCSTASAPRYHHPAPLQDAQRAIRMVRAGRRSGASTRRGSGSSASRRAATWPRPPPRTSTTASADAADPIEREGSRPDFAVLCYPVISLVDPVAHSGSRRNLLGDARGPRAGRAAQQRAPGDGATRRPRSSSTPPTTPAVPVENSTALLRGASQGRRARRAARLRARARHGVGLAPKRPGALAVAARCARPGWRALGPSRAEVGEPGCLRPDARRRADEAWPTLLGPMQRLSDSSPRLAPSARPSGLPISDAVMQRPWKGAVDRLPRRSRARPRRLPLPQGRSTSPPVPARFLVHVSADQRFVLYVNGRASASAPRAGDILFWRFETFDLAPFLKPGRTSSSAVVWNFGKDGARGADHRPHRLHRRGRQRSRGGRAHGRVLGVRAGAGPPAVARGPRGRFAKRSHSTSSWARASASTRRSYDWSGASSSRPGSGRPAAGSRPSSSAAQRPARSRVGPGLRS